MSFRVMSLKSKLGFGVAAILSAGLLAGCTGGTTYGTGKSQEAQLFDDLTGIVALGGGGKKKERIDYNSRPKLVKPPVAGQLPPPAKQVAGDDGYFPTSPEEKRAQLLAAIEEAERTGAELPPEVMEARKESIRRTESPRDRVGDRFRAENELKPDDGEARRLFLKRKAELAGAQGAAPRKYLTEPKRTFRTPAETAAVGEMGDKEVDPRLLNQKPKKSIFDIFRGG
ncbi:MAG: hypothetical protein AAGF28_01620 [Pseudomonadota bacterium]